MVWDILRFNALAMKQLESYEKKSKKRGDRNAEEDSDEEEEGEDAEERSIGDFVKREGLSDAFRDDYLLVSSSSRGLRNRRKKVELTSFPSSAHDCCYLVNAAG